MERHLEYVRTHAKFRANCEDYISQLQFLALKAKIPDDQFRYSLIHGLRPDIRRSVLQHDTSSLAEIKKWALVAESSKQETSEDNVMKAIQRLESKINGSTTSIVERSASPGTVQPRVRFSNDTPSTERSMERSRSEFRDQSPNRQTYRRESSPRLQYQQQKPYRTPTYDNRGQSSYRSTYSRDQSPEVRYNRREQSPAPRYYDEDRSWSSRYDTRDPANSSWRSRDTDLTDDPSFNRGRSQSQGPLFPRDP